MRKKEVIMSEEKNSISTVVKSLMDGAEGILTSKTVVGAPVRVGDQILIPLSDVSIGCGAGSNGTDHKDKGAGGFSARMSPTAILIIKGGPDSDHKARGHDPRCHR